MQGARVQQQGILHFVLKGFEKPIYLFPVVADDALCIHACIVFSQLYLLQISTKKGVPQLLVLNGKMELWRETLLLIIARASVCECVRLLLLFCDDNLPINKDIPTFQPNNSVNQICLDFVSSIESVILLRNSMEPRLLSIINTNLTEQLIIQTLLQFIQSKLVTKNTDYTIMIKNKNENKNTNMNNDSSQFNILTSESYHYINI